MATTVVPNQVQVEDETGIDRSLDEIMIMDPKDAESRTNETCRDFQRGYCPRGERCWFRHEGAPPAIDTELLAPGVVATLGGRALCRDYMRNHCRRGVECPYFHCRGGERCRDFDRMQDCRRGILCPFLHVSIQPRAPTTTTTTTTSTGSPALMPVKPPVLDHAGADRGGYDRRPLGSPYYREGGRAQFDPYSRPIPKQSFGDFKPPIVKTELCRDWARFNGDCPRGAGCQYLHGNPGDICRDFSRRGRCFRGDSCPFTHQIAAESKPELCMKFQKGECNRGQACPYIHAHRSPNGTGQPEVCRKFLRGQCDRGANCNYFHPMEDAKQYPEAAEY